MISKLQYITQGRTHDEIISEVKAVLEAGIDWLQLRIKDDTMDFLGIAREVREITQGKARLIINDQVDVAKEINADGVHLGQQDMKIGQARKILGDKIIGGTANTLLECKNLELEGIDYLGVGPFATTTTKEKLSPVLGLEGIAKLCPPLPPYEWSTMGLAKPLIVVGGIKREDVQEIMKNSSAHGVAISGAIYNATNKKELVDYLKEEMYGSVENWR